MKKYVLLFALLLLICCCKRDDNQANGKPGVVTGEVRVKKVADSVIYLGLGTSLDELSFGKCVRLKALKRAGTFRIDDVPPGTYCLSAFVDINGDAKPDVMREPYYIRPTAVSVEAGQKVKNVIVEGFFNERDPAFKTAERTEQYRAWRDKANTAVETVHQKLTKEETNSLAESMPTLRAMLFEAEETWAVAGNEADWEHVRALLEPLPDLAVGATKGTDVTSSLRGCFLRGYLSDLDGSIQRYAMYVPKDYDGSRPLPLVIALHPSGVNHWEANRHFFPEKLPSDFIIAAPNGYGFEGPGYRGPAEYDVMKVLQEVQRQYKIDENRIYLTGASKGGQGTWEIGLKHPELFAAIAPVCGATGGVRLLAGEMGRVPMFIFHGVEDKITSVNESRTMIAAANRLGIPVNYRYFEYPHLGHFASWRVYENGAIFNLFREKDRSHA
ncbi:MAG: prolyl oligopeptidase family serine peptidase [Candidatus Lindowbacteria bacterium]|nr:prolyl oligopeptidase family serine peptidase [Candidatus Lindowbacteria bacterium]